MRSWLSSLVLRNKTIQDMQLGFKKAYSISFLPPKVEYYYNLLLIRIFRVIGGFCIVLTLTKNYTLVLEELQIVVLIIASVHITTLIIIQIIKLVYGLYIIIKKPELFEVRNSHYNFPASRYARLLVCAKYGCQGVGIGTGILAGGITLDTFLESTGRDKVFLPTFAKLFNDVFGEPMSSQNHKNLKDTMKQETVYSEYLLNKNKVDFLNKTYDSLSPEDKKAVRDHAIAELEKRGGK